MGIELVGSFGVVVFVGDSDGLNLRKSSAFF